jgi:penicillin-binding protein 2
MQSPVLKNLQLELARYQSRLKIGAGFVLALALVLATRMVYLQLVKHEHYQQLAESNRITLVPAIPNRGVIYDRNGKILADNFSGYTLEITVAQAGNLDALLAQLSALIEITPKHLRQFGRLLDESHEFETVPLKSKLSDEEVAILAANRYRLPGVEVKARLFRNYPAGEGLSHVIGYIGRINDRDLERLRETGKAANYKGGTHIGKVGLEQQYEDLLHGKTGFEQMETDAGGRAVRVLSQSPPLAGSDLILNLDLELQRVAEYVFGDFRGGLVAIDPNTGGILAMVSKPGFDPNLFVDGIDPTTWKELNESPDTPMVNRPLRGIYPPGSTIKPFMALAALELGLRKPTDAIADPGFYSIPGSGHRYRDWKKEGHGTVDLHKSVVQSCDTYYYRLAVDMGVERMHDFLSRLGFGARSGVDLQGESSGLLPSKEWKQKRFKQPWLLGETVIAGIGQGYHLTTPMQLAAATATLANGGTFYRPRLVKAVRDSETRKERSVPPEIGWKSSFNPEHVARVRAAMVDVLKPGGTAAVAGAGTPYAIAGKTGTAQVVGIRQGAKYDESRVAERHRDHALFVAFAPAEAPRIAVAVMVENGGHGGSTAAPMARAVFDYYLLGKKPQGVPVLEEYESAGD